MMEISRRLAGGRIVLGGIDTLMLGSNDYLGLSQHSDVVAAISAALQRYGTGTAVYRVLCDTELHSDLEAELARFLDVESVLLFSSGATANSGVLNTLVGDGDVIVSDERNHASIIDGSRLSRADVATYKTCDVADLERVLLETRSASRRLVITDGVFSMEGRLAPLPDILRLCRTHGAQLVVDDAHATGVLGPTGAGSLPAFGLSNRAADIIVTGSLSKALGGAGGGFAAGSRVAVDNLRRRSRSFIFTQGMTTAAAAATLAAIRTLMAQKDLIAALHHRVRSFVAALATRGVGTVPTQSALVAIPIGAEDKARLVSNRIREHGMFVPAVAYPIVAKGDARLRAQISAVHDIPAIQKAANVIADAMAEDG
jgi:8-amino-7-oxononanoate synthase